MIITKIKLKLSVKKNYFLHTSDFVSTIGFYRKLLKELSRYHRICLDVLCCITLSVEMLQHKYARTLSTTYRNTYTANRISLSVIIIIIPCQRRGCRRSDATSYQIHHNVTRYLSLGCLQIATHCFTLIVLSCDIWMIYRESSSCRNILNNFPISSRCTFSSEYYHYIQLNRTAQRGLTC